LYGFVPRTYAGARVGRLMPGASSGDGDPLDICVLSERLVAKSEVLVAARVVGGIPMLDDGHADDKIVAVLENDPLWDGFENLADIPGPYVDRLTHYFATYRMFPGRPATASVGTPYGREHAEAVIRAALDDYRDTFPAR
ncbi:MAG TPA: inorganic diphosphatase, partial [Candidatus Krumholzibacteria bacterium]|nr:inorganic diphosphatase [Candidatus Krumholzibacteria bacterium]